VRDAPVSLNDSAMTSLALWRIVIVSQAPPAAFAIDAMCREAGHQPVAIVTSRRTHGDSSTLTAMLDGAAPDVDVIYAADKTSLEPLFRAYAPDLVICCGFPWLIREEALDVPRLGAINAHPSKLPLYRGPIPLPWAVRNGETEIAMTVHRMDANFDTGAILAQAPIPVDEAAWTFDEMIPHFQTAMRQALPRALERIAAGDEGEPQKGDPGVYAAWFEDEFSQIDWSKPAREIHNQVRAWSFLSFRSERKAPVGELDGEPARILRTSLEPGEGTRVETGDGPIWVTESEPA
jgi:methionyl-tRNA formyltransferase